MQKLKINHYFLLNHKENRKMMSYYIHKDQEELEQLNNNLINLNIYQVQSLDRPREIRIYHWLIYNQWKHQLRDNNNSNFYNYQINKLSNLIQDHSKEDSSYKEVATLISSNLSHLSNNTNPLLLRYHLNTILLLQLVKSLNHPKAVT